MNSHRQMIDFHTHILPGIDDGSRSVEMSLQMFAMEKEQGVEEVILTPHFYASENTPDRFIARRQKAWEQLAAVLPADAPHIHLGAEVYYFSGISHTEELSKLTVEGTNLLLLEMPFHRWPKSAIEEAAAIAEDGIHTVVLAHIDRYLKTTDADTWKYLANCGVRFQINADAVTGGWLQKRRIFQLITDNKISALASDCHNMSTRRPNLGEAVDVIEKKLGPQAVNQLMAQAAELLQEDSRKAQ